MKYRVVATNSDSVPYIVQRKNEKSFFPFWRKVAKCKNHREAFRFVRDATERHSSHPNGMIVLEFDESDLVVERLKNQQNSDRAESNVSAQSQGVTMAMANAGMVSREYVNRTVLMNQVDG